VPADPEPLDVVVEDTPPSPRRRRPDLGSFIPPPAPGTPAQPRKSVTERELAAATVLLPLLMLAGAVSSLIVFALVAWLRR
jgi:hypothetical protein